ncbi:uncharacterized protein LOC118434432 [Folsomia candida]|nr:uncharacterized protein LOC118434432 [Folsomia candida]
MESCGLSSSIIPYASVASVYCLLMELITNFLWLFGDWLLLLVSLIMAHMFRRINVNGIQRIEPGRLSSIEIDLVREHHGLMSKLVKDFDDAIASLNVISVVLNTAYIILSIYSIVTLRRGERVNMGARVMKLYGKIGVAIFKMLAGLISASVLHHRAHEMISEIRSWPMAREFNDFSLNNGRAAVMQAFVSQLSQGDTGLSVGKVVTITGKLMTVLALGVGVFVAFARITISSCSRGGTRTSSLSSF